MTNDSKPPMFGHSFVIDPASYEPRSGKSALMGKLMAELSGKPRGMISKHSTPMKFDLHDGDLRHYLLWGSTREDMSEAGK